MSLLALYSRFLASPSAEALAEDASLHYIPTITSIHDAASIMKHIKVQAKVLKKKVEKPISVVEGMASLSGEFETTIEFLLGGGAILPGLDDNFLSDKTVYIPMVGVA